MSVHGVDEVRSAINFHRRTVDLAIGMGCALLFSACGNGGVGAIAPPPVAHACSSAISAATGQ